jgi:hypothetical protein
MQSAADGSRIRALLTVSRYYGLMAFWIVKLWPRVTQLSAVDRRAALRAIYRGKDIGEARLAQDVIDSGRAVRAAVARSRLFRWLVALIVIVLLLGVEIALGLSGLSLLGPVFAGALAVFFIEAATLPRQLDKVGRAEKSARQLLAQPGASNR